MYKPYQSSVTLSRTIFLPWTAAGRAVQNPRVATNCTALRSGTSASSRRFLLMPIVGPLLLVVVATITGVGAATFHVAQERSDRLYGDLEADIRETLRQHELRKIELATLEQAPPFATGATAKPRDEKARDEKVRDDKARKAKIGSIKKRATGHRRERFVPPDFARLPIAIARGFLR